MERVRVTTEHIRVTTESGYSWETTINGTEEDIKKYFLGVYFNIGVYPHEKLERVVSVIFIK
jgi:hypothetical protein